MLAVDCSTPTTLDAPPGIVAECPRWDDRRRCWFWIDIPAGAVHAQDLDGARRQWLVPAPVGCIAFTADPEVLIVCCGRQIGRLRLADGRWAPFAALPDSAGPVRINDGAVDPNGRFWFGTTRLDYGWQGAALYRLEDDGGLREMLPKVSISNGLAWWQGRMFYADSPLRRIDRFAWNASTGDISGRGTLHANGPGPMPDGIAIDREGGLWVAMFAGAGVVRLDSGSGEVVQCLDLPVSMPTAVALGGERGDQLLITSARDHAPMAASAQPALSGRVFSVQLGRPLAVPHPPATRIPSP